MPIDETDYRIIAHLKEDPRTTNRALARALQLSEPNIAARVARLEEMGILRIMAVVDMHAVGYEHVVIVGVGVGDSHPSEVANELVELPEVLGVNSTFGRYQLVCIVLARDKRHVAELVDRIGTIDGVLYLESCLVLDVHLMRSDVGLLRLFRKLPIFSLPQEHSMLDKLDLGIIEVLQENGRTSFREVGRRLATPEATIRSRLTRLEKNGAVRLVAVTDSDTSRPEKALAWIALRVRGGALEEVADVLCHVSETGFVSSTIGRFNMLALLLLDSRHELLDLVSRTIAPMHGVQQLEVWEIVHSYKQDIRISMQFD